MRKLRPGCSIHRVRGRSGFELRPSGFKKAVHVSATTLQHFRWAGNLAITESKPVILQLRKQQPTERAVLAPNPQGMGSRAGLRSRAVAESQRWGQGCGPSCTAPPHPAPNTKCPFFPFWEWVQRVGGWGGRGLEATRLPSFSGFPRQPLSRQECWASSPEGAGPHSQPQTSLLCALHPGPLQAFTSQPSEHFSGLPGQVAKG